MNKLFTKIATAFVGMAMAIGVGVAIGNNREASPVHADNTITFESASDAATNNSVTKGGITLSGMSSYQSTDYRFYKGATVRIASTVGNITSVSFTFTNGSNNGGWNGSTASYSESGLSTTTWTKTCTSGGSGKQARITRLDVTYAAAKTVSSIAVTDNSGKTWYAGDTLSASDLRVVVTYSSGSATITDGTGVYFNSTHTQTTTTLSQGSNTITVYYQDDYGSASNTVSISAQAARTLSSIALSGTYPTTFDQNDAFSHEGMVVTASYSSGNPSIVTGLASWSGYNMSTAGNQTVTVSYTENGVTKTATYSITVKKVSKVVFTPGTDTGDTSVTKSGVTVTMTTMNNASYYQIYASASGTFTAPTGRKIEKIEFTCTASGTDKYGPGNTSITSGGGSYSYSGYNGAWTGSSSEVVLGSTAQVRMTTLSITLDSTDPVVELDVSSATSVTMMRGDSNTGVKVHVVNIESKTWTYTFDENEEEGLSSSSYINVSAGAAVNNVHTLTITTKPAGTAGSTVLHISVSGTACETAIPVTVNPKPASMTITHSDIHEGAIEIITGAYKQVSFSGEDTDGNAYAIAAGDVTPSATSGASHVTLSGSRITGASEGDAVVRYTLNALTSVYADLTVHVVDDYIESVGTPTFASNLTSTQGQSPTVSIFTSRPGTMHSGGAATVPFENYKFSYDENYASSEYGSVFGYDFSHGTTVDATHKLQTIYVFSDIDEAAHGSYTVTVEQGYDPLTAITFTNVVNNEVDVTRGSSFQLEWAYTPTNPTDGKEVEFVIDNNDDGIGITVSSTGLIGISASSALGTALVLIQSAHDDTIKDYVYVTATLESMKYTVNEAESWEKTESLSVGDKVILVGENEGTYYGMGLYADGNNVPSAGTLTISNDVITDGKTASMIYTVVAGTEDDSFGFKGSDDKYIYASSSSKNYMYSKSTLDANGSFAASYSTGFSLIAQGTNTRNELRFNYNQGTPIFSCYGSTSTLPNVEIYKKCGGDTEYDVTEILFNGVHNNFGDEGKTYEWDASCSSFNSGNWLNACNALKGITGYANYKLNRAVGDINGNEIEVFLAKYDNIIGKFGKTYDHLARFSGDGINASVRIGKPINIIQNSNTVMIVLVVSLVSVTAVGGYFLLRKKKED